MEELLERFRILENIRKYLIFEGVEKTDELFKTIDTMCQNVKNSLKPDNSCGLGLFADLLHRKINFTTDISELKEGLYKMLTDNVEVLWNEEENVEKKIVLSEIYNNFKHFKYFDFFNKYIDKYYSTPEISIDEKETDENFIQFERELQWIISLMNAKCPEPSEEKNFVDGGGIDWRNIEYKEKPKHEIDVNVLFSEKEKAQKEFLKKFNDLR